MLAFVTAPSLRDVGLFFDAISDFCFLLGLNTGELQPAGLASLKASRSKKSVLLITSINLIVLFCMLLLIGLNH